MTIKEGNQNVSSVFNGDHCIGQVNTDEEPMVFKAQLMALTGVQVI